MTWSNWHATVLFFMFVSSESSTTDPTNPDPVLVEVEPSWIFQSDLGTKPITIIMTFDRYIDLHYIDKIYLLNLIYNCTIHAVEQNITGNELWISLDAHNDTNIGDYHFVLTRHTGDLVTKVKVTVQSDPLVTGVSPILVFSTGGIKLTVSGSGFDVGWSPIVEVTTSLNNNPPDVTRKECSRFSNLKLICTLPKLVMHQIITNNEHSSDFKRKRSKIISRGNTNLSVEVNLLFQNRFAPLPIYQFFNFTLEKPSFQSSFSIYFYDQQDNTFQYISGSNILTGCSKDDYHVRLGSESCSIINVNDNQMIISLPSTKQNKFANNPYCADDVLPLMVYLGDMNDSPTSFFIRCLKFKTPTINAVALGVGLGVGLFALLLLSVFIALCLHYCAKVSKQRVKDVAWEHNNKVVQEFIEKSERLKNSSAIPAILQMVSTLHEEEIERKYGTLKTSAKGEDDVKSYAGEPDIVFIDDVNPMYNVKVTGEGHTEVSNDAQPSTSCDELNSSEEISKNLLYPELSFGKSSERGRAGNT